MPLDQNGASDNSSLSDEATLLDVAKAAVGDTSADGAEQETAPGSSPDADANKPPAEEKWDPLSAVKRGLDAAKKSEVSPDGEGEQEAGKSSKPDGSQDAEAAEETDTDLSKEEMDQLKPKTRKRMEFLLSERAKLTGELEDLRPQAEQFQELTSFMRETKLGGNELAELMVVGGLAKSDDPADLKMAITKTEEFLQKLKLASGDMLPEDLQKKVDEGLLDADTAKENATLRIKTQKAESKAETVTKTFEADKTQNAITTVHQTISNWSLDKASKDPDFQNKSAFLQTEIELRVAKAGGRVLDPAKATQIAEEAYAAVNAKFKTAIPAKPLQAKNVLTSRSAPGNTTAMPTSALEAAKLGLANARQK